eukprot:SAG31_NODE_1179_length_9530_cov_8.153748_16_plen_63_part_00
MTLSGIAIFVSISRNPVGTKFSTQNMIIEYLKKRYICRVRQRRLVVRISPLHGEDRGFNPHR